MSWQDKAACKGKEPDLWFPDGNASTREAKAVCAECPVRVECLAYAIETRTDTGIWGGLTEAERRGVLRRNRPPRRLLCDVCAKPFVAKASTARYCSQACRQQRCRLMAV